MPLPKARGGVIGSIKRIGLALAAAAIFARLYLLPAKPNVLPQHLTLAPAW